LVGDGLNKITFRVTEMKSKRPFEAAFPGHLQRPLYRYLEHYRPYLLSLASASNVLGAPLTQETALWISSEGRAVDPGAFSKSITRRTLAAFGRNLTPHFFRDASVTTLIRDAPDSALLTKTVLGHGSIDITYNHYNQAQMIESSRRHANLVAALQQHSRRGG
jgi:integrase/recombinase XerC